MSREGSMPVFWCALGCACGRPTFAHRAIAHVASSGASPAFVAPVATAEDRGLAHNEVISGAGPLSATIEDTRHGAPEADVNKRVGFEHHPSAKRWSRGDSVTKVEAHSSSIGPGSAAGRTSLCPSVMHATLPER